MKIFMFPGQGSQSRGMGGDLFDRFKDVTARADGILGYSIRELCLHDPRNELGQTRFTQPALYVVNALSCLAKIEDTGQAPDVVIGHSLGEFNALLAAGCFDFESGLKLVQKRGELMGEASGGAMAAVMFAAKEEIEEKLRAHGMGNVHLANYNTPSQIVISGSMEEIAAAEPVLMQGKVRYYPLATSGAFHSPHMADAMAKFRAFIEGFHFAAPRIPVIANVTARPYRAEAMADTLASQIASTVRWCESMQYLMAQGLAKDEPVAFEEVGNGDVLTKMAFTIRTQTPESVLREILRQVPEASQPATADAPAVPAGGQAGHEAVPAIADASTRVAAWNEAHPIGTKLRSTVMDYGDLETRTEAVLLFGHRAAVYMKGYNGYFALDELALA